MGLLKLALGLRAGEAAPNAQLRALNPHVADTVHGVVCVLSGQLAAMMVGSGGVSSFGYSGTIAHAVLRQTTMEVDARAPPPPLAYSRHAFLWCVHPHPFAQHRLPASNGTVVFRSPATGALHSQVADHIVQASVVFPGAGYLEMARAAGGAGLQGVFFLQPLAVEAAVLLVDCAVFNGRFEVRSGVSDDASADAAVHCSGELAAADDWQGVDHASARPLLRAADIGALYDSFDAAGLQYGPCYRTLVHAWGDGSDVAAARLRARATHEGTHVHPADLDDALCVCALVSSGGDGETRLPFAVDDALLQGALGVLWAVRPSPSH